MRRCLVVFLLAAVAGCSRKAVEPTPHPLPSRRPDSAPPTIAQPVRQSPHETISLLLEQNRVTVVYGRPHTDDPASGAPRRVWGGLVPYNKVWRLGADEATLFITQKPIDLGGTRIAAGAYTLFLLLKSDDSATLLVNSDVGEWGIDPYHFDHQVAEVPLRRAALSPPVHQFTVVLDEAPDHGGVFKLLWEDRQYSVPYAVIREAAPAAAARTEAARK